MNPTKSEIAAGGAIDGLIAGISTSACIIGLSYLNTDSIDAKINNLKIAAIPCAVCLSSGALFGT